jgi:hypothetical protein
MHGELDQRRPKSMENQRPVRDCAGKRRDHQLAEGAACRHAIASSM